MSESINIGNLNSGTTIIGGKKDTITASGVVNVYGDQLASLRALLDELVSALDGENVAPEARKAAESARAEAAKPAPEPGRLHRLMGTVMDRAKDVGTVSGLVLNVLKIIDMLGHGPH